MPTLMKRMLINGICGLVGSTIALRLRQAEAGAEIVGFDNFIRAGSELNPNSEAASRK
jgi:nucleoside-diphosphate-sugar epimerase